MHASASLLLANPVDWNVRRLASEHATSYRGSLIFISASQSLCFALPARSFVEKYVDYCMRSCKLGQKVTLLLRFTKGKDLACLSFACPRWSLRSWPARPGRSLSSISYDKHLRSMLHRFMQIQQPPPPSPSRPPHLATPTYATHA
jgi:hypothetical protein